MTEGDVEAALDSFKNIELAFGTNRFDEFHTALRDMSLSDNNLMEEMLNPMKTLVGKINRLPEKEKFAKTVAKNGFTPETWGITVDKIIKARRVANMSPAVTLNLSTWRKMKKPVKATPAKKEQEKKTQKLFTVNDLTSTSCRWPIGDPKDENFHFCGKEALPDKPYCAEHAEIAYVSAKTLR